MNRLLNLNKLFFTPTQSFSTHTKNLLNREYNLIKLGNSRANQRIYFEHVNSNKIVSPFHDIPLYQNANCHILNMIVEIPRFTNAKMEINKKEKLNPIIQDSKNNKLRYVDNVNIIIFFTDAIFFILVYFPFRFTLIMDIFLTMEPYLKLGLIYYFILNYSCKRSY